MKKNLYILLSFATILLAWCTNNQTSQINPDEWMSQHWSSIEDSFSAQVDNFQYIQDLENYLSLNTLSISQDQPYTSDFSFSADFDQKSSVQWWVQFSQQKVSKSHNLESADIQLSIKAEQPWDTTDPFDLFWDFSLLYQDNEMYANLHEFQLNMWEWNSVAKMYTLLSNLLINKWVDLEIHKDWIISLDQDEDDRLLNIISNLKNTLNNMDIETNTTKLIDAVNWYINLWISTDWLTLVNQDSTYFQNNTDIQKSFTWNFEWNQSSFDLSFTASKDWLDFHLYNIKSNNEPTDTEFFLSIQQDKKSEYDIDFSSFKSQQKTTSLKWSIKIADTIKFSADFVLEPLELISGETISGKLNWSVTKKSWIWDREIPQLSWDILSLSELLSSL